jgi:hypothetical protein
MPKSSIHSLVTKSFQISAAALIIVCALISVGKAQGLAAGGARSPVQNESNEDASTKMKAARASSPLSRLYDSIRVEYSQIYRLPPIDKLEQQQLDSEKKLRVGVLRSLPRKLDVLADATVYHVAEGSIRIMGVVTEGALFTRVHFTKTQIPAGAKLFVYSIKNPDEVYGPYEGTGDSKDGSFWTPPMEGDGVAVEYFSPDPNATGSPFEIQEVSHIFQNPNLSPDAAGSCNLEVTSPYTNAAQAVGYLEFTTSEGEFICTGTLLNTKSSSFIPYLITANHCFSTQSSSQSLRVYWRYNSGDTPPAGTSFTDGSNLLATQTASDFTFVRLTGSVPGGLWYNGWTTTMPAAGDAVGGIHHPQGSHKRISFGSRSSQTSCPSNIPGPCGNFVRVNWSQGVTEGGSSGSELVTGSASDPRYVGNLWGGSSSCSSPTSPDWYGRFDVTYPNISSYLDDTNSPPCTTSAISIGQTVNGTLSTTDCRSPARGNTYYTDRYSFSGTAQQQLVISQSSTAFDSYLYLRGPNGDVIVQDDDGGGSLNSQIQIGLPSTGTYVLEATSYGENSTGAYSLTLGTRSCSTPTIGLGQTASGSLTTNDCRSPARGNTYFVNQYLFSGTAQQRVAIALSSSAFDSYLYLRSPGGQVIAQDDDSGGDLNSRIPTGGGFFTLPSTGTYVIEVTSFGEFSTGSYALSLISSSSTTASAGLYNPATSTFFLKNSNSAGAANLTFAYGPASAGWTPVVGDWDGNGTVTAGLFNPATSTFFLKNTNAGGSADLTFAYGPAGANWIPVVGDWNGDGTDTVGLYQPSTSTFFLKNSNSAGAANLVFSYGPAGAGWLPLAGDWNGDGTDTIGLYQPSGSTFFLKNTNAGGSADIVFGYGPAGAGWTPVVGDWNQDGTTTAGLYNPASSTFFLKNTNTAGSADLTFGYGPAGAGWKPLAGDWDGL